LAGAISAVLIGAGIVSGVVGLGIGAAIDESEDSED
jgi:hypothetical protein